MVFNPVANVVSLLKLLNGLYIAFRMVFQASYYYGSLTPLTVFNQSKVPKFSKKYHGQACHSQHSLVPASVLVTFLLL